MCDWGTWGHWRVLWLVMKSPIYLASTVLSESQNIYSSIEIPNMSPIFATWNNKLKYKVSYSYHILPSLALIWPRDISHEQLTLMPPARSFLYFRFIMTYINAEFGQRLAQGEGLYTWSIKLTRSLINQRGSKALLWHAQCRRSIRSWATLVAHLPSRITKASTVPLISL